MITNMLLPMRGNFHVITDEREETFMITNMLLPMSDVTVFAMLPSRKHVAAFGSSLKDEKTLLKLASANGNDWHLSELL